MPLLIPKYGGLMTNTNGMEYYFEVHIFVNEQWIIESTGSTKENLIFKRAEVRQEITIVCNDVIQTEYLEDTQSSIEVTQRSDYSGMITIPSSSYDHGQFQRVLIL